MNKTIMKRNVQLSVVAFVLLVISLYVYHNDHSRNSLLVSGSDFLKGLDVDNIEKIVVEQDSQKKIELKRDGMNFYLENFKMYPASNELVNKFLFKLSNIQVADAVINNKDKFKTYKVEDGKAKYTVKLFDAKGIKIVEVLIGDELLGRGNYIRQQNSDTIYLSSEVLSIETDKFDFMDKEIVKIDKKNVSTILFKKKNGFVLTKEGDDYLIGGADPSKINKEKVGELVDACLDINFDDYSPVDDSTFKEVDFSSMIIQIKAQQYLAYNLSLADYKSNYYLKVSTELMDAPSEIKISKDDSKDDLAQKESVLLNRDKSEAFNRKYQLWIYKISKSKYDALNKELKDLMK